MSVTAPQEQVHVEEPEACLVAIHLRAHSKLPPQAGVEVLDRFITAPVNGKQVFFRLLTVVVTLKVDADPGHDDLWGRRFPRAVGNLILAVIVRDEAALRISLPYRDFIHPFSRDVSEDVALLFEGACPRVASN